MNPDQITPAGRPATDLEPLVIPRWSGREVRALRQARRMSVRDFAKHLGVTARMVSKWEAGGDDIHPRPVNQEALDTSLARSSPESRALFRSLVTSSGPATDPPASTDPETPADASAHEAVRHPGDGKTMVLIDAGIFLSGADRATGWLDAFYIDVYPTTNADYQRFVAATGHHPPHHWHGGRCPEPLLDHPVVFVTWHDANSYAEWSGKTLPSALQWEKAARGSSGSIYPWGNQGTPAKCNVRESRIGSTTPVDRYHSGASPYGVYDLCGNTWEWCSDETDPGRHHLKGSAFTSPFSRATPSAINDASADMFDDDTGFRCVANAEMPPGNPDS
jgi:formylglycine-generating enzyme required for sulfatase activity